MTKQDPLEYLPLERWSELQSAFKADWPRGISGYAALEVQRRWKDQGIDYGFKVHCPFGDVSNGMVAVNQKDTFYEIIIQSPNNDTKSLTEALNKTEVIDWNRTVVVPYATRNVLEGLENTAHEIGLELDADRFLETFILEKAEFEDVSLPPNITFGPVTMEHLGLVDSTWPNRYPNSSWHFKLLIHAKCGYGLYLDNALISWVFIKEAGPLQHLFTVEEHRKNGYAEMVLKLASKIWLNDGIPVFGFCFKDNHNACKLYKKIGFNKAEEVTWCYVNKKVK